MTASSAARAVHTRVHRDLARAISAVENGYATLPAALSQIETPLPREAGASYVVGVTGPPGAGKSTLVDRLIESFRARGETVAVIAVDPSSPFTGGAVLGDRVRMQRHAGDTGVFIRSMASRESGGGLAPSTHQAIALAERAGFDVVIVETVGVGQVELEIVGVADVVRSLTVPALGDGVQTIKAGLTEIADIFVVNMADRPGANRTAMDLVHMVRESRRAIPVLQTTASEGAGIAEVMDALAAARVERRFERGPRSALRRACAKCATLRRAARSTRSTAPRLARCSRNSKPARLRARRRASGFCHSSRMR